MTVYYIYKCHYTVAIFGRLVGMICCYYLYISSDIPPDIGHVYHKYSKSKIDVVETVYNGHRNFKLRCSADIG